MTRRIGSALPLALCTLIAACGGESDSSQALGSSSPEMTATTHLNPLITLHETDQSLFGLYAPSPGGQGRPGAPPPPTKTPDERAAETLAYGMSDYVFDGSMEGGVERGLPAFMDFRDAMLAAGARASTHPFVVKMAKIESREQAIREVGMQLDAGASGIMFVEVESAEEVRWGLEAMRYAEHGGTRPEGVGSAPSYWGVSDDEYRDGADLWPLDPDGELISWVIVESHEGLANVREIAAVPGVGVLWPGAGTLRRLFSTVGDDGQRVLDEEGWENAIQTVLAACKEFDMPCGYPANASDIEMRMEQGFSVFVMGWGERGFETVEMGRQLAGR
ncbi:MAG: aldolase/citrate lyase family protein [Longimicrobiales bacterium]